MNMWKSMDISHRAFPSSEDGELFNKSSACVDDIFSFKLISAKLEN